MLSIFDLFKIGIGPSSSHTVGPMVAGRMFADLLGEKGLVPLVSRIQAELYGSLALTGEGHGTIGALLNGLEGARPDTVEPVHLATRTAQLKENADLILAGDDVDDGDAVLIGTFDSDRLGIVDELRDDIFDQLFHIT